MQDLQCLPPYRNAGCGETEIGNHDLICTGSMSSMLFYRFPPFPVRGHFSACRPSNFFDSAFVHVCVRAVWLSEEGRTWESLVHPPDSGPGPLQAAFALYQNQLLFAQNRWHPFCSLLPDENPVFTTNTGFFITFWKFRKVLDFDFGSFLGHLMKKPGFWVIAWASARAFSMPSFSAAHRQCTPPLWPCFLR